MIRATISFPQDMHEQLRQEAFSRKISLGGLVVEKIRPNINKLSVREKIKRDFALFDKIAASGISYDAAKALREERDRDNG